MSKNLSRELIISEALRLIDKNGTNGFSVRQLSANLGVQASSLYNHIKNENDILLEVSKKAADIFVAYMGDILEGCTLDEAAYKAGDAFREFVTEHGHLYELLIDRRWKDVPEFEAVNDSFTQPIMLLLQKYGVRDKAAADHLHIAMRVITHGFSTLEMLGMFNGLSVDPKQSYHLMIKSVIDVMKNINEKK